MSVGSCNNNNNNNNKCWSIFRASKTFRVYQSQFTNYFISLLNMLCMSNTCINVLSRDTNTRERLFVYYWDAIKGNIVVFYICDRSGKTAHFAQYFKIKLLGVVLSNNLS